MLRTRKVASNASLNQLAAQRVLSSYRFELHSDRRPILVQRRHAGFLAGFIGRILARGALAVGGLGSLGYAIDTKVREWEATTFKPVLNVMDRMKDFARRQEFENNFRNFEERIKAAVTLPPLTPPQDSHQNDQNEREKDKNRQESLEIQILENSEEQNSIKMATGAVLAATILTQHESETSEKEKEMEAELEKIRREFKELEEARNQLVKTIEILNRDAEVNETTRAEMLSSIRQLQDAASAQEVRHHKKVEKMEGELERLHARLATAQSNSKQTANRESKAPKSLVELYSTVLDELESAKSVCPSIVSPDLPRVVVVGDQSSGKTSVLEAVARARIFPRGAGQMMTRSPVKVTIMDGPRHVATFPDAPSTYYRLDEEEDLSKLRSEIERRMAKACRNSTISSETVSVNISGPGLRRMVLVDLPGIIATETAGIKAGTAADIVALAQEQMSHKNAIILCVQDGSVDAERSQVTNFVRHADPSGERTLLVLTKVDKAVADPVRLKQILDGKLFPLRALGYFAVVSGTEDRDASITQIRQAENSFFGSSQLLHSGILKAEQLGTQNMCEAVSRIFWNLVKTSILSELDKLKEQLFLLETEWKTSFRHARELDRAQLFQKGKDILLDRVVELENLDPGEFESSLREKLWQEVEKEFLRDVYLTAEESAMTRSEFNTISDIRLHNFSNHTLPTLSLRAANDLLLNQFDDVIVPLPNSVLYDQMFQATKDKVAKEFKSFAQSISADRSAELKIIQQSTIDNRFIQQHSEWESAATKLQEALKRELSERWEKVYDLAGPVWYQQYWRWTSRTDDQFKWDRVKRVLETLPLNTPSRLPKDEVYNTRMKAQKHFGVDVSESEVDDIWADFYPTRWLKDLQHRAIDCKRCFSKFKNNQISEKRSRLHCDDVLLWWRMDKTVEMTAANLRQKLLGEDGVNVLADSVKQTISNMSDDEIHAYLTGRQVELAEELKFVRRIHKLLKELHEMLVRVGR